MTNPLATVIVHTPSGPVPCCDNHAVRLQVVMASLGCHVNATIAPPNTECTNCVNEAKKFSPATPLDQSKTTNQNKT